MRILPVFSLLLTLAIAAEPRIWTDVQDRKIEATMVRMADQSVILKLKDGREIPYPLTKLSEADRAYAEQNRGAGGDT